MYIHIGEDTSIIGKAIVGIFDFELTTEGSETQKFIADCKARGLVQEHIGAHGPISLPRSFILAELNGKTDVHISNVSTSTISARCARKPK